MMARQGLTRPQDAPPAPIIRRTSRRIFRWEFLLVPLAILGVAWFLQRLPGPTFEWQDIVDWFGLSRRGEKRFTQTALLGLVLIAVVYVYKMLKGK